MTALHPSDACAALYKAVLHAPDDDTVRLAYADALEESAGTVECPACKGNKTRGVLGKDKRGILVRLPCEFCSGSGRIPDGLAARAEFVRVGVELARIGDNADPSCGRDFRKHYVAHGMRRVACVDCWRDLHSRHSALLCEHEASWRRGARCEECGGKGHYRDGRAKVICGHACHGRGWLGSLAAQLSPEEIGVTNGQEFWRYEADWSRGLIYRVHAPLEDIISPDGVVEDWAVRCRGEWPVTSWWVTDREPNEERPYPDGMFKARIGASARTYDWGQISSSLPRQVWDKLLEAHSAREFYLKGNWRSLEYDTPDAARHALATALGSLVTRAWHTRTQTPAALDERG